MSKQIARAMTTQLRRVNESPERLLERIDEQERLIDQLRARIRSLESQLAQAEFTRETRPTPPLRWAGQAVAGRPVITLHEAAQKAGISYISAWRRASSGKWSATQDSSRQWLIYADQPLTR